MLMRTAAHEYGWKLNYSGIALMWRGGCIIRSVFLGDITKAYQSLSSRPNANRQRRKTWRIYCLTTFSTTQFIRLNPRGVRSLLNLSGWGFLRRRLLRHWVGLMVIALNAFLRHCCKHNATISGHIHLGFCLSMLRRSCLKERIFMSTGYACGSILLTCRLEGVGMSLRRVT